MLSTAITSWIGCDKSPTQAIPTPPPSVSISQPLQRPVVDSLEYTGTTSAIESVDVRARVKGFLLSMDYQPRAKVSKGTKLFVIDPDEYRAKVEMAQALLEARKAEAEFAKFEAERTDELFQKDIAAPYERNRDQAKKHAADAAVKSAEANLFEAQLQLGYTTVIAPISGRVSRNQVDVGNLVGAEENTLLTTIVNDDSLYVYFDMSENDLLALIRARAARGDAQPEKIDAPVFLALSGEQGYPHAGRVDFIDTTVNPATGTIRVRGIFPNDNGDLLPGLFARVRIPIGQPYQALLITERAIGIDQGQRFVYVVNDTNIVEYRRIEVGLLENGLRVITRGLQANDRVIVVGLQRVRPGAVVAPHSVAMDTLGEAASKPAGILNSGSSSTTKPTH